MLDVLYGLKNRLMWRPHPSFRDLESEAKQFVGCDIVGFRRG